MVEGAEGAASAPVSAAQPGSGLPGDGDGSPPVGNKRPRKGAAAELTAVKAQLMERGVPGVDSRTSVPTLIQLLVQHGLANREAFPEAGYWKIGGGGQRNTSRFAGPEAARGWRVWLDKGETAEQLSQRAQQQLQGTGVADGDGEDAELATHHGRREAAAARPSAEKYTGRAQRLVVYDKLCGVGQRLAQARFTRTVSDLDTLVDRVKNLHVSFRVAHVPRAGAPAWQRHVELMLRALFAVDYVHVTPGLLVDHMPDRHYGAAPCGEECDGGHKCGHLHVFQRFFNAKVGVLVCEMLDEHVFGALWDLMDSGALGGSSMPNDAVSAALSSLVTSFQMCAPFDGRLLEITEASIRAQWLAHVKGERVIYVSRMAPGTCANSGRVLQGSDPPHYSSLARENFAAAEGRAVDDSTRKKGKRVAFSPAQEAAVRTVYEEWEGRGGKENEGLRGPICPRRNSHRRQRDKAQLQAAAGEGHSRACRLFKKVRGRVKMERAGDSVMGESVTGGGEWDSDSQEESFTGMDLSVIALDESAGEEEADDERLSVSSVDADSEDSFDHALGRTTCVFDSADLSELSTMLGIDDSGDVLGYAHTGTL